MKPEDPHESPQDNRNRPSTDETPAGETPAGETPAGETPADECGGDKVNETAQWFSPSDQTMEIPKSHESSRVFSGTGAGETAENDPNDETVGPEDITNASGTFQPFGIGSESNVDQTDLTLPNIDSTIDMGTVRLRPQSHQTHTESKKGQPRSVMQSADVSQTINPRELSKEDAADWGAAAGDESSGNESSGNESSGNESSSNDAQKSKLRPAVERSLTESKLQIRKRDLAVPSRDPDSLADFRLVRLLGRGGMGNVYVARQGSLDRMIAVKVIKPLSKAKRKALSESGRLEKVEHERRQQFLSEAVVTGDLDHPNIVPIHDIAVAADNTLFYAMKRVVGQPWLKTIKEKTRDENLEILLKVCDAIAFAHTRGVIHRDIKPENIMIGDFGEVLVMDWGLAIAKPEFEKTDSITFTAGLGGTPSFMAPEMAIGPVDAIGPQSDIYLLGATLFYVITGDAPHKGDNVSQCIRAVAANKIRDVPPDCQGELLDIALKAMATDPKDRYKKVKDLQQAIRQYRSHSESIAISTVAANEYQEALKTSQYNSFFKGDSRV